MADPSLAEMWGALSSFGRPTKALAEAIRLSAYGLPLIINQVNANESITIPLPAAYREAPQVIDDTYINSVCWAGSVNTVPTGTRDFTDNLILTFFWIFDRVVSREQVDDRWDGGSLIRAVFQPTNTQNNGAHTDPNGYVVWEMMIPQAVTPLPVWWSDYSGICVPFLCAQPPGNMLWAGSA